ncbi:PepSY-associated TM helix [Shewanella denitrificans OS217]|uniref:PepSY-associated TM helix n=1 Tax=Shewanella denitrificans (strain OS217 / ATCC BAA-1090 / DSM 15013) TaxID=318161 RepID=Q12RL8_SHEDO|nr:PepSY-associated TM helix domain-containing protein [Shewanella denitrificans]ABE53908.1 PepSY-associated TM helix [Shewanella denitrificans OS217]
MKIRSDILRTYQSIHTWTGILSGLVLFIGFYAGALSLFKPQITQWATPVHQHLAAIPQAKLDNLISQAFKEYPKTQQGFIVDLSGDTSPLSWYTQGGGRGIRLDDIRSHASLDDNDKIISQTHAQNELGSLIDQLHRTAGILGEVDHFEVGVLILGLAAGLYFLALVSGVIFLLPTLTKNLFALRKNKGASRFWLDSHNLIGVISLPFHLIIAWTVVVFAFHDFAYGGLGLIYGDKPLFERPQRSAMIYKISDLPSIQTYINKVAEITDGYDIKSLTFSNLSSPGPALAINITSDTQVMRSGYSDVIYMHPYTLEVQFSTASLENGPIYDPIVTSFFALHFGNYAGNFGRLVYFILGLLGAFLFYSGNLLWLEKRRQKQSIQSRANRFMGALTIGVCLGSMLGVACSFLITKWLYLVAEQVNTYYMMCYYSIFFSALGYSFIRGTASAAIHLLYALFLSCLLIPTTSLLAVLLPSLFSEGIRAPSSYLIDVFAALFAIAFYLGAKKVQQRAYYGEPNSIWAISTAHSSSLEKTPESRLESNPASQQS